MPGIRRILVPADFSPASDIALQYAIDMAERLGAGIHLVHVVDDAIAATAYPDEVYVAAMPELCDRLINEASDQLKTSAARCVAAGVTATREALAGAPARVISQTAASREMDLIVMGTHGRGVVTHFLIGSVAERVIRTAPCAVLTVRDTSRLADALAVERVAPHNPAPSASA